MKKTIIYTLIISVFFSLLYGCSQRPSIRQELPLRTLRICKKTDCHVYDFDAKKLETIYTNRDVKQFEEFLSIWSQCSQKERILDQKTVPEFILDAYEIFQDFYNPYNLSRLGKLKGEQDIYKEAAYFIIQENLMITKREILEKDEFGNYTTPPDYIITINDFYPKIDLKEKIPLHLSVYPREYLLRFLGDESYPLGDDGIMNPARAKGDSLERQKFVNKFLRVLHGHWEGWHVESDPYVFSINFNKDYSEAMVDFRIVYKGGEAKYQKTGKRWKLIKSEFTWIE